jgi:hypothetical protein
VAATFYEVAVQPTAQTMTDWLYRQGEHGKIELEDTQTAVEKVERKSEARTDWNAPAARGDQRGSPNHQRLAW